MYSKSELRSVFDRVVLESLGPLSLGMALAFSMFTILGFVEAHPPGAFELIVGSDALCAVIFFLLYLQLRQGRIPPQRANFIGVAGGQLALINSLVAYYMLADHFFLVYIPIIVVGYGSFLLSRRWFAASVSCSVIVTLAVTYPTIPTATLLHYAPAIVGAALLGTVLLVVRRWSVQAADAALRAARSEIAERRRVEARLAQSQRLESVGRLVSGVAHDFNNLLMPIIGYADLALATTSEDDELHATLSEIRRAGESAAGLTAKLLAFSRQQVLQAEVLDINDVIGASRSLLEQTVREDVQLTIDLDPDSGHVRVDPIQLQQVLLNLAINARDAMPGGGELTITTRPAGPGAASDAAAVSGVELCVRDNGVGITPEVRERLFEPFFTTKEKAHGTGLGLATVHGIVTQSGGSITVHSEPGEGATFCIVLPGVAPSEDSAVARREVAERTQAGETVLLVEDERQVRTVVTAVLRSYDYRVLEASSPQQALSIAGREAFDILVTDVVMPGMGGVELAAALRSDNVEVPVVFMSGYAPRNAVEEAERLDNVQFVSKPFRAVELLAAVRAAQAVSRTAQDHGDGAKS